MSTIDHKAFLHPGQPCQTEVGHMYLLQYTWHAFFAGRMEAPERDAAATVLQSLYGFNGKSAIQCIKVEFLITLYIVLTLNLACEIIFWSLLPTTERIQCSDDGISSCKPDAMVPVSDPSSASHQFSPCILYPASQSRCLVKGFKFVNPRSTAYPRSWLSWWVFWTRRNVVWEVNLQRIVTCSSVPTQDYRGPSPSPIYENWLENARRSLTRGFLRRLRRRLECFWMSPNKRGINLCIPQFVIC